MEGVPAPFPAPRSRGRFFAARRAALNLAHASGPRSPRARRPRREGRRGAGPARRAGACNLAPRARLSPMPPHAKSGPASPWKAAPPRFRPPITGPVFCCPHPRGPEPRSRLRPTIRRARRPRRAAIRPRPSASPHRPPRRAVRPHPRGPEPRSHLRLRAHRAPGAPSSPPSSARTSP